MAYQADTFIVTVLHGYKSFCDIFTKYRFKKITFIALSKYVIEDNLFNIYLNIKIDFFTLTLFF